jgi:hypothetical protein
MVVKGVGLEEIWRYVELSVSLHKKYRLIKMANGRQHTIRGERNEPAIFSALPTKDRSICS